MAFNLHVLSLLQEAKKITEVDNSVYIGTEREVPVKCKARSRVVFFEKSPGDSWTIDTDLLIESLLIFVFQFTDTYNQMSFSSILIQTLMDQRRSKLPISWFRFEFPRCYVYWSVFTFANESTFEYFKETVLKNWYWQLLQWASLKQQYYSSVVLRNVLWFLCVPSILPCWQ